MTNGGVTRFIPLSNIGDIHLTNSPSALRVQELEHRRKILLNIGYTATHLCDDCADLVFKSVECQLCGSEETGLVSDNLHWYLDKEQKLTNMLDNKEGWFKSLKDLCLLQLPQPPELQELNERWTFLHKVMRSNGYVCETCVSQIM